MHPLVVHAVRDNAAHRRCRVSPERKCRIRKPLGIRAEPGLAAKACPQVLVPGAFTDAPIHAGAVAADAQQRLGDVEVRHHLLVCQRPIGDVVALLLKLPQFPGTLVVGLEAKVDRQGAERPRAPQHRAAAEHRAGPAAVERARGIPGAQIPEGVVVAAQAPLGSGFLRRNNSSSCTAGSNGSTGLRSCWARLRPCSRIRTS